MLSTKCTTSWFPRTPGHAPRNASYALLTMRGILGVLCSRGILIAAAKVNGKKASDTRSRLHCYENFVRYQFCLQLLRVTGQTEVVIKTHAYCRDEIAAPNAPYPTPSLISVQVY